MQCVGTTSTRERENWGLWKVLKAKMELPGQKGDDEGERILDHRISKCKGTD